MHFHFKILLRALGVMAVLSPALGMGQDYFRAIETPLTVNSGSHSSSDYSYRNPYNSGIAPLDTNATPAAAAAPAFALSPYRAGGSGMNADDVYNFALGPLRFRIGAGLGIEFNDNITLSNTNRESDLILRPTFDVDLLWHATEMNTLRLSVGASYAAYMDHSDLDTGGLLLSPQTQLGFQFSIGSVLFNVYDSISYQQDPYDVVNLSGVAQYNRLENVIGLDALWNINSTVSLQMGLSHYNLVTFDSVVFDDQNRANNTITLRPSYAMNPSLRIGLSSTYTSITFDSSNRSDGYSALIGPYINWQITPRTMVSFEVGYQKTHFDGPTVLSNAVLDEYGASNNVSPIGLNSIAASTTDNNDNSESVYFRLAATNRSSEILEHRLSASKTTEVAFFSNYFDLYHVEYSAGFTGFPNLEISPSVFYEYYETSNTDSEKASRVGASLGLRRRMTPSITVGLDYRFILKDSNYSEADYTQNSVFLSIFYRF